MRKLALLLPLAVLTQGCLAKTAFDVVTLPVKAAGQATDWATTSQEESDRNYGRKARRQEAREGKERREWERRCRDSRREDGRVRDGCERYEGYRSGD